jgi:hypothetical protein
MVTAKAATKLVQLARDGEEEPLEEGVLSIVSR